MGASALALLELLSAIDRLLAWPLVVLVLGYRKLISPGLAPACRFYPSCSAYADLALRRFGVTRGLPLTLWRLLRCQPWSRGGVDPVPCRHGHAHKDSA